MKRREFITLLSRAIKNCGSIAVFAGNVAFALIVLGLIAIDLIAAEYAATGGKMMALHEIATTPGP